MFTLAALLCLTTGPAQGMSRGERHAIVELHLPLLQDPDPEVQIKALEQLERRPYLPAPLRLPARGARCIQAQRSDELWEEQAEHGTYILWSCRRVIARPSLFWTVEQRRVVRAIRAIANGGGGSALMDHAAVALSLFGLAPRGRAKSTFEGVFDYPYDDAEEVR